MFEMKFIIVVVDKELSKESCLFFEVCLHISMEKLRFCSEIESGPGGPITSIMLCFSYFWVEGFLGGSEGSEF